MTTFHDYMEKLTLPVETCYGKTLLNFFSLDFEIEIDCLGYEVGHSGKMISFQLCFMLLPDL